MRFNLDKDYLIRAAIGAVISTLLYKAAIEPTINKLVWNQ